MIFFKLVVSKKYLWFSNSKNNQIFLILVFLILLTNLNKSVTGQRESIKNRIYPSFPLTNEKRLIDDIVRSYHIKFGRPVNNMSEKVIVYFEVFLIQLIDLVSYFN